MPPQRNSLQAVLERQARAAKIDDAPPGPSDLPARTPPSAAPRKSRPRPSRQGLRLIAGHFEPHVAKQLKLLAAEEDTTVQALLAEALDLLFIKKGKGAIIGV